MKPCANAELPQSTELNVQNMIISPTRHDTQRLNGLTFPVYLSLPCFYEKVFFLFMLMKGSSTMMHSLIRRITFSGCVWSTDCASRVRQHSIMFYSDSPNIHFRVSLTLLDPFLHVTHKLNPISISYPENPSSFVISGSMYVQWLETNERNRKSKPFR